MVLTSSGYGHIPMIEFRTNVRISNGVLYSESDVLQIPWVNHVPTNQVIMRAISKGIMIDSHGVVYGKIPVTKNQKANNVIF